MISPKKKTYFRFRFQNFLNNLVLKTTGISIVISSDSAVPIVFFRKGLEVHGYVFGISSTAYLRYFKKLCVSSPIVFQVPVFLKKKV